LRLLFFVDHVLVLLSLGFACFSFICAFFIFLGGALFISPVISGSAAEKKMLSKPDELEGRQQIVKLVDVYFINV